MGLETKIENTLDPWLCYYCGTCSDQCPREADPGETMMSLRRWLISKYDFTGIARAFFRSKTTEILAIVFVALLTAVFMIYWGTTFGNFSVYDGEGAFLSSSFIHKFDLMVGSVMIFFLVINAVRMWYFTMIKGTNFPIPFWLYIKNIFTLPLHFLTQKRYAECEKTDNAKVHLPWIVHLGLMLGYVIMLLLVMVFIEKLQQGPQIDWRVHIFGYLATIGLVIGTIYFIRNRVNKKKYVQYKKSHGTDWVFIVMLFMIVITGVVQHVFHRIGLLEAANVTYVVHLMFVVPWLLRMPFSKWAHLAYRPLAMYFAAIIRDVKVKEEALSRSMSVSVK